jgi:hypothetical protein
VPSGFRVVCWRLADSVWKDRKVEYELDNASELSFFFKGNNQITQVMSPRAV